MKKEEAIIIVTIIFVIILAIVTMYFLTRPVPPAYELANLTSNNVEVWI